MLYPKYIFRFIWPATAHMHFKTDKVDFKKAIVKKSNSIFLQSTHQVDMKNWKEFFGYFNALQQCVIIPYQML